MSRRILSLLLALSAAFALAACSGLPTTGSVNPGLPADEVPRTPDFLFVPNSPQPGMTPQQIVQGFIDAGTSPVDNWAIARLFLAPEARSLWNPEAGVTIDSPGDRVYTEASEDQITVTVTPSADVDETGAYAVSDAGATALPFRLAQQSDGEWRIVEANDGIVLDRDFFVTVFDAYSIMFFDPTWEFLVPDVRWFPARENSATRIATALVDGAPSPWLAASLETAFPEDVALASQSVTVDADRAATVELRDSALALDPTILNRMQAQLEASLADAGVQSVQMAVDGAPLEATAAPTRSTNVTTSPLVLNDAGFGFLAGGEITPIPGLSDTITENLGAPPTSIQVGPQRDVAALQVAGGVVARAQGDGTVLDVDTRPGLVAPSIDPSGYIWSVPHDSPTALFVSGAAGTPSSVAGAWGDASQIQALSVSRDGTRVVALVTVGGQHWAVVAGVVRDANGLPTALGDAHRLARLPGPGISVAWLDDVTIGVAASDSGGIVILDQLVGGEGIATDGPVGVTSLAGANQPSAVRLRDGAGILYIKRGTNWAQAGTGIFVLATQQGAPR
ncbi:MAG TPA: LpqB family beta-propeller domain-containing protein [Microbacterium sp.]|uniref:GerMN domain-containing protein n=1 Tax=Microbacterium sp. TaxID=51671 RepID=UPI002CF0EC7A|nr:LpqB family beta-propeller domain-containing protein [Microbacterium sp.]HWI30465.1 LpqB family beta-propeller domain-containing protein [Microbacterium sp.]